MNERFLDPITLSFNLLERYKLLLRESLLNSGLTTNDVEEILKTIEVDKGIFFTLNRKYEYGINSFRQFCRDNSLSDGLADLIPIDKLYLHQEQAILSILDDKTTVTSTGTGSGKTESFLIPIFDYCLKNPGSGIKAIIIYPMNALANDQIQRISDFTKGTDISFGSYIGSTPEDSRDTIRESPPNILVTNYVMLDRMLTRHKDQIIFTKSKNTVKYIVLDEIHSYRGNKATHLRYLLLRLKSLLNSNVVQIGCSATLENNDGSQGIIKAISLDNFIKPLLDVESYEFIKPTFKKEPFISANPIPIFSQSFDNPAIGTLQYSKSFETLQQNEEFIIKITESLHKGAQSFDDFVEIGNNNLQSYQSITNLKPIVKEYLSAISYINYYSDEPLLDFRIHLFFRDIGGHLKKCIKCKKYRSGHQEFCEDCGTPLFHVYKGDINKCIGKISGNKLKSEIRRESEDKKNSFYVLISFNETKQLLNEYLCFKEDFKLIKDEIILDYDHHGGLRLEFPIYEIKEEVIPLTENTKDYQYLHNLVRTILDFYYGDQKKLLGFIDNREKASQYSSVLKDEFISQFFEEFLKLNYPEEKQLNIVETLQYLHNQIPIDGATELEIEVFKEIDIWYARFILMPPRFFESKKHLLKLNIEKIELFDKELIQKFIDERAIDNTFNDDMPDNQFIRFYKHWATDHRGFCFSGEQSKDPKYESIAFSERSNSIHKDFVKNSGHEEIQQTIKKLLENDIIIMKKTPDGKNHYYLNRKVISFNLQKSKFKDYQELKEKVLLTADLHSSEIQSDERKIVENKFQGGKINFLIATPTLELGIDIGKLQNVMMIGVPPLPSNYAQRAGRAGRGNKGRYALITTFCSEDKNHDVYYFGHPKKMINGMISPPSFDPNNEYVIKKHINALVLSNSLKNKEEFDNFMNNIDTNIQQKLTAVHRIFGNRSNVEEYLFGDFKKQLEDMTPQIEKWSGNLQQFFYSNGFFPDYSFRKDQVSVVDLHTFNQNKELGKIRETESEIDYSLSDREPEQAYYKFSPGEIVFMAGNIYKLSQKGKFSDIQNSELPIRSYRYFDANKLVRFASKSKICNKYNLIQKFENTQPFVNKKAVLKVSYNRKCILSFYNNGIKKFDEIKSFKDDDTRFIIGYDLERQVIILEFDKSICADQKIYLSLASALDRTIKDKYGLDESEIRLLIDAKPKGQKNIYDKIYVLFYDFDGNGTIPMEKIFKEFDDTIANAHQKMKICNCENGCYVCLKSYYTHFYAQNVSKDVALMFTGYLLGKNEFSPVIVESEIEIFKFDLVLTVEIHGEIIKVKSKTDSKINEYFDRKSESQNATIFRLIIKAIKTEFSEYMKTLKILSKVDYIVKAINKGEIEKDKDVFIELQFNLLRFKTVKAENDNISHRIKKIL